MSNNQDDNNKSKAVQQGVNKDLSGKLEEFLDKTPDNTSMVGIETTVKTPRKEKSKVVPITDEPIMTYDPSLVDNFLGTVFHSLEPNTNILAWHQKGNTPYKPHDEETLYKTLERSHRPFAFYFGTSSVTRHEDGNLYNRKAQFSALHVVVLDDIGTKIPLDKLPKALKPNYIIESSEGNYQYGYILDEPLTDLAQAEALVHLVYTSGISDGGGKMPTKAVRLPCGVNGKQGVKQYQDVKLIELNDNFWSPTRLLEVLDVGVTWAEVQEDAEKAKGGISARMVGTSLWSSIPAKHSSLSGIVDPLLEWLYEEEYVINDNGDWVTILCPNREHHSEGGSDTAGYSPIGRGGQYNNLRSFKCQHDHCKGLHIGAFLKHTAELGAPQVPAKDEVADLVADYAYINGENMVARIRGVKNPTFMKVDGFRNTFTQTARVYEMDGKLTKINESALWLKAPNRLILAGRTYDPTNTQRITDMDGQKYLNTYTHPDWGNGSYDQAHVDKFNEFLEYLMPIAEERDYFIQWLSAKAQNPCFKGSALLMVAPVQGTGRTTLTDMVTDLFTMNNVAKVTFDQLLSSGVAGAFNGWQENTIVTCDEVMSSDSNKYSAYETLKDMFDPRPKAVKVNNKYEGERQTVLYTSYIMLTNHVDAIGALGGDRRVYVISNTSNPASNDYFSDLNEWIGEKDYQGRVVWANSVWRWLQTLAPDVKMLTGVAPSTSAKVRMELETSSAPDVIAKMIIGKLGFCIPTALCKLAIKDVYATLGIDDPKREYTTMRLIKKLSSPIPQGARVKIGGKLYAVRAKSTELSKYCSGLIQEIPDHRLKAIVSEGSKIARDFKANYESIILEIKDEVEDLGL